MGSVFGIWDHYGFVMEREIDVKTDQQSDIPLLIISNTHINKCPKVYILVVVFCKNTVSCYRFCIAFSHKELDIRYSMFQNIK